ncbi:MAG: CvpA family protein [Chloroflexota bacterium]
MNWLDIVILIVMVITTLYGLRSGLIKTVLDVVGLLVGIVLAGRFYSSLAGALTFVPSEGWAKIIAFIIILVAVIIVAGILARLLKWLTSLVMLGWLNHLLGAVFGLVWGGIVLGALLTVWVKFFSTGIIGDSALARILVDTFPLALALLPDEFNGVRTFFQ